MCFILELLKKLNLKNRKKYFVTLFISITIISSIISQSNANPKVSLDVWDEGDWITYEISALFSLKVKYTVVSVSADYIEFTSSQNTSVTRKINTSTGMWINDTTQNTTDEEMYTYPFIFYPNMTQMVENMTQIVENMTQMEKGIVYDLFSYNSQALIKVDSEPTVIPVLGLFLESWNCTEINETVTWCNKTSARMEFHEQTGILINLFFTSYSNSSTYSLFSSIYPNTELGYGVFYQLVDSHGVFELNGKKDTTSTTTVNQTTGFTLLIVYVLPIIYHKRKCKRRSVNL